MKVLETDETIEDERAITPDQPFLAAVDRAAVGHADAGFRVVRLHR